MSHGEDCAAAGHARAIVVGSSRAASFLLEPRVTQAWVASCKHWRPSLSRALFLSTSRQQGCTPPACRRSAVRDDKFNRKHVLFARKFELVLHAAAVARHVGGPEKFVEAVRELIEDNNQQFRGVRRVRARCGSSQRELKVVGHLSCAHAPQELEERRAQLRLMVVEERRSARSHHVLRAARRRQRRRHARLRAQRIVPAGHACRRTAQRHSGKQASPALAVVFKEMERCGASWRGALCRGGAAGVAGCAFCGLWLSA